MKKKAGRSRSSTRSNKKSSSDIGCLWSAIKTIFLIVLWPFTLIYRVISALINSRSVKSERSSSNVSSSRSIGNAPQSDDEYQAVGLYEPTFVFSTVDGYKEKLKNIRDRQREMVHDKTACIFPTKLTYNGSVAEGNRLVNDWMRLMLRAFNGECDVIIDHVSFLNFDNSKEKIKKSAQSINAIGSRMSISISDQYVALKLNELTVAYDYQQFKQIEKDRIRQIREDEREKAKFEKELQERRAKIIKDQKHVANELSSLSSRLESATPEESATIQSRIAELNEYTQKLQSDLAEVAQREQQARAGYVYIISNIGSFGENIYKIGMTRRLDPQDRIDELGDASVPFRFDVHAFIFSEDAVALESALHNAFASRRVNLVNLRREFFHVTLDEIEACVKQNFSETVEFTRTATAQEYRESETIRQRNCEHRRRRQNPQRNV